MKIRSNAELRGIRHKKRKTEPSNASKSVTMRKREGGGGTVELGGDTDVRLGRIEGGLSGSADNLSAESLQDVDLQPIKSENGKSYGKKQIRRTGKVESGFLGLKEGEI